MMSTMYLLLYTVNYLFDTDVQNNNIHIRVQVPRCQQRSIEVQLISINERCTHFSIPFASLRSGHQCIKYIILYNIKICMETCALCLPFF